MIRFPDHAPFVLLSRADRSTVEVLTGDVVDSALLADLPLLGPDGEPQEVLALVPYQQVRERGFEAAADTAKLTSLIVRHRDEHPLAEAIAALPEEPVTLSGAGFDIDDQEYAEIVRRVIRDEIGHGEGANFVIRRDFTAHVNADARTAALTWFRALLEHERGAYWTFAIVTDDVIAVGASPEAHVVVDDGVVTMNPISGTFRHPADGVTRDALTEFLRSTKETEELFMVVDEELKMMSSVCSNGGRITGPHLKVMSRLTHTEYVLRGESTLDPRDILRETMFAPTVTGSPMQNACAVIRRHETSPRGYYSGVAALFTPNERGGHNLDAPILIRTAYLDKGVLRVPVGATLVRHSDPYGEVSETHGKAAGVLGAIGAIPRAITLVPDDEKPNADSPLEHDPEISALLESRNERLAPFWMRDQSHSASARPFAGRSALVIDAEDRFTTMLAHQLRHLGLDVRIALWSEVDTAALAWADLVVFGPGPGDPRDVDTARIARLRSLVHDRFESGNPMISVCLSHQVLADRLGIEISPLASPHQGVQFDVDVFGESATIGYYNTFTARVTPGTAHFTTHERAGGRSGDVSVSSNAETGDVYALKGEGFTSVQGHLESILSRDGIRTLERLVSHAIGVSAQL